YLHAALQTYHHPVGTSRIGADDTAVVDAELRVRGVTGLRVADASVMPSIVSGNTMATVYGIAERASSLIQEWAVRGYDTKEHKSIPQVPARASEPFDRGLRVT